ncbi:hypothetical protein GCM10027271_22460 [Saccharopolyspora gloriosae]|uniref:Uncharacterized protein n=1 Tax=Saccharopolyspora gloriosae TaxID=455344 RepID=A0A840NLL4_9PSEU|nr:hypothetical protein [Saccharopolyspora gloriosae]MBB5070915.1 hypothetical protein [Saccharopolyspora gloriosae]
MGSLVQAWFVAVALLLLGGSALVQSGPIGADPLVVRCGDQVMRPDQSCHIVAGDGTGRSVGYAEQRAIQQVAHGWNLVRSVLGGAVFLFGAGLAATLIVVKRPLDGAVLTRLHGRTLRPHR